MATDVQMTDAEGVVQVTLNGSVKYGDPIAYNGTGWVQADASDASTNLYAQYIAGNTGVSGDIIPAYRTCTLYDADAPYTVGSPLYVSGTAGSLTHTRPAADGDVIQVVGWPIDTYRARIDIKPPREEEFFYPCSPFNEQSGGSVEEWAEDGTTDEWAGPDCDGTQVATTICGRFPSGIIGNPTALDLIVNTQGGTALDIDVTFVAAYINGTNTGDAGCSIVAATTSATTVDNRIQKVNINGMDADFVKAGRVWSARVDPDAGDFLPQGIYMRCIVV